jgi:uncharacterized membrane protein YoaK (UPF0700 family)
MKRPRQQVITLIAIALTFGSGATDVASFTRLGNVFASVMTGNIVLCGLALARGSMALLGHSLTAIGGYVAGVAVGSRLGWYHSTRGSGDEDGAWAPHVRMVLLAEVVLLAGLTAGWELCGSRPTGWAEFCLLAVAAAAMGVQGSAVTQMGLSDVSTTYLTGTLTGLVGSLAKPGGMQREGMRRPGVLLGLLAGALLCGLFVRVAPAGAPVLPLAALIVVLVLSAPESGASRSRASEARASRFRATKARATKARASKARASKAEAAESGASGQAASGQAAASRD